MAVIGGAAASGNDLYNVPTSWPWAAVADAKLTAFYSTGTTPVQSNQSQSGFWSAMTSNGAVDTGLSRTADTYRTQVDITGEGHMGTIIFPYSSIANVTNTARITVDGVQYVCVSEQLPATDTAVLGFLDFTWAGDTRETTRGAAFTTNAPGITIGDFTNYANGVLLLPPISQQLVLGIPVLRFKESLKVELKQSVTSYSGAYRGYSTVQYRLTGDVS